MLQPFPVRYFSTRLMRCVDNRVLSTPELELFDSRLHALKGRHEKTWLECSLECKLSMWSRCQDLLVDSFNRWALRQEDPEDPWPDVWFNLQQLDEAFFSELELACRQALGEDVVLEVVGSRARGTGHPNPKP